MGEFVVKLVVAFLVAVVLYGLGRAIPVEWMHWWVAGLCGLVVSFGGWFIIVDGDL